VPRAFRSSGEESLERGAVPREYRDAVRSFFDEEP
jgi:hypothetical protein